MGYKMTPDTQVHGLYRRSTAKGDKWVVSARVKGGNPTKITLGYCSNLPAKEARTIAKRHLADMALGINPNTQQRLANVKGMTLGEAIEQFLAEKGSTIKASTVTSYRSTLGNNLKTWMNKPINSITPQDCVTRYKEIKEEVAARSPHIAKVNEPGEAEAQKAMRSLSSVLRYFANDMLPDNSGRLLPFGNPVSIIADKRIRKELKPRQSHLNFAARRELLDFLADQSHYRNEDGSTKKESTKTPVKIAHTHWIILLLCTGLRHDEPLQLKWEDVDLIDGTFTIQNPKNSKALTLPMTKRVRDIFKQRYKAVGELSPYVFPQDSSPDKPATMNRVVARISRLSNIQFTAHDLRRTTATALNEIGYSYDDIGRILNHSNKNITAQYVQTSLDAMREALEELEHMLFDVGVPDEVGEAR
jgi:integrase